MRFDLRILAGIARKSPGSWLAICFLAWTACASTADIPLEGLQTRLGWTSHVVRTDCVEIDNGINRLRMFPGRRRAEVNGYTVWLHRPAMPNLNSVLTLYASDVEEVLVPLLSSVAGPRRPLRVMLDPGHGGEDGGAISPHGAAIEKEFTLDLALRIGRLLEREGVTVGYTRNDDEFVALRERAERAATWDAQVFVSLHANYASNHDANGRETYVLPLAGMPSTSDSGRIAHRPCRGNRFDRLNTLLGFSIHRRLPGRMRSADRGLRRARYQVLREAPCPAVLVECGFLSNRRDAELLASPWYRDRLSRAIAEGIMDYSRHVQAKKTVAAETPEAVKPVEEAPEAPEPAEPVEEAIEAPAQGTEAAEAPEPAEPVKEALKAPVPVEEAIEAPVQGAETDETPEPVDPVEEAVEAAEDPAVSSEEPPAFLAPGEEITVSDLPTGETGPQAVPRDAPLAPASDADEAGPPGPE